MTDKQIIDKVNVKECKYYCNGKCERYEEFVEADYANYSVKCICEKENDLGTYDICDYQQLKIKEQECKDLREDIKDIANLLDLDTGEEYNFGNIELEIKQLKRKEQECEELKEKLEAVYDNCKGCSTCNEALYNANLYAKEYRKLKQTLAEIKKICNNNDELKGAFNLVDCDKYKLGKHNLAQKIIVKINEVENV